MSSDDMKKQQLIILISSFFALLTILFLTFWDFTEEPEVSTDIEVLYGSLTDYMKEYVDSHLSYLNCEPEKYYDYKEEICFVCEDYQACFGYGSVQRRGGEKKNPRGNLSIKGRRDLKVSFVDFCLQGLASKLKCKEENESDNLDCGEAYFINKSLNDQIKCNRVKLKIQEDGSFQKFAKEFCEIKGEERIKITDSYVVCGEREGCREDLDYSCDGEDCGGDLDPSLACGKYSVAVQDGEIILLDTSHGVK